MQTSLRSFRVASLLLVPAVLILFASAPSLAQKLDQSANGMSDIWEQIYGAAAVNPIADSDGDGVPNAKESIAGTNPFDANSVPRIPAFTRTSNSFSVTLPCALGKLYQLQSIQPS